MLEPMQCPCGLKSLYENCCGLYIENPQQFPPHPEALMRSRYTAFVLGKITYIEQTMKGKALKKFDAHKTMAWLQTVSWQGLHVKSVKSKNPMVGFVTFEAKYTVYGSFHSIIEKSEFHKIGPKWYYVSGRILASPKISKS